MTTTHDKPLGGYVRVSRKGCRACGRRTACCSPRAIEDAGGVVLSASEQLDPSTPEGRFAREVLLGIARMQREKYREGFEDAKRGAIKQGIPIVTRPAVGYRRRPGMRNGKQDRRLAIDEKVAPAIRKVLERRAAPRVPRRSNSPNSLRRAASGPRTALA